MTPTRLWTSAQSRCIHTYPGTAGWGWWWAAPRLRVRWRRIILWTVTRAKLPSFGPGEKYKPGNEPTAFQTWIILQTSFHVFTQRVEHVPSCSVRLLSCLIRKPCDRERFQASYYRKMWNAAQCPAKAVRAEVTTDYSPVRRVILPDEAAGRRVRGAESRQRDSSTSSQRKSQNRPEDGATGDVGASAWATFHHKPSETCLWRLQPRNDRSWSINTESSTSSARNSVLIKRHVLSGRAEPSAAADLWRGSQWPHGGDAGVGASPGLLLVAMVTLQYVFNNCKSSYRTNSHFYSLNHEISSV